MSQCDHKTKRKYISEEREAIDWPSLFEPKKSMYNLDVQNNGTCRHIIAKGNHMSSNYHK